MSDTVQLVLTGQILPGFTHEAAVANLARLMRLDIERAGRLLHGAPAVIKHHLPQQDVASYTAGLNRAGLVVQTRPSTQPPAAPAGTATSSATVARAAASDVANRPAAPGRATVATAAIPALAPLTADTAPAMPAQPALALVEDTPQPSATMTCPSCGHAQRKRTLCLGCGTDMPRMLAAREADAQAERQRAQAPTATTNPYARSATASNAAEQDEADGYETPSIFSLGTHGRLGRMRYLAYVMVVIGAAIPLLAAALLLLNSMVLTLILAVLTWWLYVRQTILRLHDLGLSGYWITGSSFVGYASHQANPTLGMVVAGVITLGSFALCVVPGTKSENEYGVPAEPPTTWISVLGGIGLVLSLLMLPYLMKKENLRHRYDRTESEAQASADGATAGADSADGQQHEDTPDSSEKPGQ